MATQIIVGSFTPSVVLDVARTTGSLAEQDLDVVEVPVSSSPAQFRALLDGEISVALTSPDNVLAYRYDPRNPLAELADVRIVGAVDRGMGLGLYGRPGRGPDDLRGSRVGVDVPGSGFALALYALAESLGVSREDYDIVALGSTPRRLDALLAGDCDATMLNAGNELVAEAAGCPRLAAVSDVCFPYLGTVVAVAGDGQHDEGRRLASALTTVAAEITGGRLDEQAEESAARRLSLDPDLARRYVERMRSPDEGLVADGVTDRESLETLVSLRRRYLLDGANSTEVFDGALDDPGLVQT